MYNGKHGRTKHVSHIHACVFASDTEGRDRRYETAWKNHAALLTRHYPARMMRVALSQAATLWFCAA
jgi:hypothetical protein